MTSDLPIQGFDSSSRHILAELERIDLLIQYHVARAREHNPADQAFQGLYISDNEIDTLLSQSTGLPQWAVLSNAHSDQNFRKILESRQRQIAARKSVSLTHSEPFRLDCLVKHFQLTAFERDVLLICLAPECDLRYERLYAYLQDDVTKKRPTVDLVLNLLSTSFEEKIQNREIFFPTGNLMKYHLLSMFEEPTHPHSPLLGKFLKIDERVTEYLLGSNQNDPRLHDMTELICPQNTWTSWIGPSSFKHQLQQLVQNHSLLQSGTIVYFQGPYGVGKHHAAEALAHDMGKSLFTVDTQKALRMESLSFETIVTLVQREALFHNALPYWSQADDLFGEDRALERAQFWKAVKSGLTPMILSGRTQWEPAEASNKSAFFRIEFPRPGYAERLQWWSHSLNGQATGKSRIPIEALANTFRLTGGQITNAAIAAKTLAHWRQPDQENLSMEDLAQACRLQTAGSLGAMARKLSPRYTWDDIVLPPELRQQLKEIRHAMTYRSLVYDQWGFGRKQSLGKGLNVLFAGPSGTGKTMAAEILAHTLHLDVYQIDLSQVVSKYIGETEKHLSRIFAEAESLNAMLFFDEADALFGKRSEVRDAHDRYANMEVGYLLQRMEEYQGMVILATNFRKNMDDAFIRRLHMTIDFPYPAIRDRREIWERMWPQEVPRSEDLDMDFLARQFELTGGNIRNIAVAAAFLAADDSGIITMTHVLQATRREYQKMGKVVSENEFLYHPPSANQSPPTKAGIQ